MINDIFPIDNRTNQIAQKITKKLRDAENKRENRKLTWAMCNLTLDNNEMNIDNAWFEDLNWFWMIMIALELFLLRYQKKMGLSNTSSISKLLKSASQSPEFIKPTKFISTKIPNKITSVVTNSITKMTFWMSCNLNIRKFFGCRSLRRSVIL
jgi:hypothetical protein